MEVVLVSRFDMNKPTYLFTIENNKIISVNSPDNNTNISMNKLCDWDTLISFIKILNGDDIIDPDQSNITNDKFWNLMDNIEIPKCHINIDSHYENENYVLDNVGRYLEITAFAIGKITITSKDPRMGPYSITLKLID